MLYMVVHPSISPVSSDPEAPAELLQNPLQNMLTSPLWCDPTVGQANEPLMCQY